MSKKWKTITWILLGIPAIFFLFVILISLSSDSFIPDWRFSVADGIQILVVIAAVLLPMYTELWKRKEFGPKPNIRVDNKHPFLREKKIIYPEATIVGQNKPPRKHDSFNNVYIGIENVGREVMLSCEVKISEIHRKNPETMKWETYQNFLPFNLYWEIDGGQVVKSRHIDIKPGSSQYAILGFYKVEIRKEPISFRLSQISNQLEERNTYFWFTKDSEAFEFQAYSAHYRQAEPTKICTGEYKLDVWTYCNNIPSKQFDIYLRWDGSIQLNNHNQWTYSPIITLRKI